MEAKDTEYEEELIPVWEAAHRAEKSISTTYASCARGVLRFQRTRRQTLVEVASLINLLKVRPGRPMGSVKLKTPPEVRLLARLQRMGRGHSQLAAELELRLAKNTDAPAAPKDNSTPVEVHDPAKRSIPRQESFQIGP
jgi:hypothetical protein